MASLPLLDPEVFNRAELARRWKLAREAADGTARAPRVGLLLGEFLWPLHIARRSLGGAAAVKQARRPRTVMLLPGFGAHPVRMRWMAQRLEAAGHTVKRWGEGINLGATEARFRAVEARLVALHEREGAPLDLVGWSLGGVFARELAKQAPDKVRLVISLGSPISDDRRYTNARKLFEYLNGSEPEPLRSGKFQKLAKAPPVPTTSILTKTDGIVHWRGSVQHGADVPGANVENIEVYASHCGLGVNPAAIYAIADRLAQAEGAWKRFEAKGLASLFFPVSKLH